MHMHVAKAGKNSIPFIIEMRKLGKGKTRRYRIENDGINSAPINVA